MISLVRKVYEVVVVPLLAPAQDLVDSQDSQVVASPEAPLSPLPVAVLVAVLAVEVSGFLVSFVNFKANECFIS